MPEPHSKRSLHCCCCCCCRRRNARGSVFFLTEEGGIGGRREDCRIAKLHTDGEGKRAHTAAPDTNVAHERSLCFPAVMFVSSPTGLSLSVFPSPLEACCCRHQTVNWEESVAACVVVFLFQNSCLAHVLAFGPLPPVLSLCLESPVSWKELSEASQGVGRVNNGFLPPPQHLLPVLFPWFLSVSAAAG